MNQNEQINKLNTLMQVQNNNISNNKRIITENANKLTKLNKARSGIKKQLNDLEKNIKNLSEIVIKEKSKWYGNKATSANDKKKELLIKSRDYKKAVKNLIEKIEEEINKCNNNIKVSENHITESQQKIVTAEKQKVKLKEENK